MKIQYPIKNSHNLSIEDTLQSFQTNVNQGLTVHEADNRNKTFGLNIYESQPQKSIWLMILEQFKSPIVYLLAFAIAVSVYFEHYI